MVVDVSIKEKKDWWLGECSSMRTEVIKEQRELQYVKVHKLFFVANITVIK